MSSIIISSSSTTTTTKNARDGDEPLGRGGRRNRNSAVSQVRVVNPLHHAPYDGVGSNLQQVQVQTCHSLQHTHVHILAGFAALCMFLLLAVFVVVIGMMAVYGALPLSFDT
jgi:hypothetical protein